MRPTASSRRLTGTALQALLALVALTIAAPVSAQSAVERLKQKVKQRVETGADRAVDRALDKVEGRIHCLTGDDECIAKAEKAGKPVVLHESQEELDEAAKADAAKADAAKADAAKAQASAEKRAPTPSPSAGSEAAPPVPFDAKVWENYDFVPGERVLFADDYARDRVGNFPQRLQHVEGNAQVVEARGKRWLSATSFDTRFHVNLPELLPTKFTVEFEMTLPAGWPVQLGIDDPTSGDPNLDAPRTVVYVSARAAGLAGGNAPVHYALEIDGRTREALTGVPVTVRLQGDGDYLKVYVNERRIANAPKASFGRAKQLRFWLAGSPEEPTLVGPITVAAGGMDMYDALMANGRVATQGILFDTGSDRIRPESAPTLQAIGDMLRRYGDLRVTIEGHTDNVGNAAANLSLSDRRAAAVKAALVATHGIDAGRLQTKGFGDTKPAAPNTSPEGRQQNRRVELVRL